MLTIGLTGGIASGKTTISQLLAERGATVIDADKVGHEVYRPRTPGWRALLDVFGADLAGPDSVIDRRKLGALVFNDPAQMKKLTGIVWPRMKEMMRTELDRLRLSGVRITVLEAAVLFEAGWQDLVDEIWAAVVAPGVAVERLIKRNGLSEEQARARLASQLSNEERARQSDIVIDNSGSLEDLSQSVDALWREALQRAA